MIFSMQARLKSLVNKVDLHKANTQSVMIYLLIGVICLLSVAVRKSLVHFQSLDYQYFSAWYDFAKEHGIHSFKYGYADGFTNYNPPYTYALYLSTLLPISKIMAIKGILAFFDIVLAIAVYFVVRIFRPKGHFALVVAILTMFLPTVLFNGVLWGQFDQLYVAFILFSLWAILTSRSKLAWAFFGIALAVKFQAIFFLPVLGIASFRKIYWHHFLWGGIAFLLITLPPIFAGRSLGSLLSIYPDQARLYNGQLTLNAPNIYQWVPNSAFNYLNDAGIYLTFVLVACIVMFAVQYRKFTNKDVVLLSTLMLYIVPFFLPAMHERYFFPASIASTVLAVAYPTRRFIAIAIASQVITVFSYCPFLFGTSPVSMSVLALGVLCIICLLGADYFLPTDDRSAE